MFSNEKTARQISLERQVERLERRLVRLSTLSRKYSWVRLAIVLMGAALAIVAFRYNHGGWAWSTLFISLVLFIGAVVLHNRVIKSIERHKIWRRIKTTHIARMTLDWSAIPSIAEYSPRPDHPFEIDLDLTGPRSLFHLLDTAITHEGSERLRSWLLEHVPDPYHVYERQHLVRELVPLSSFRDRLMLNGTLVSGTHENRWEGDILLRWLDRHTSTHSIRRLLILLSLLAVTNITLTVLWIVELLPALWIFTLVLYIWIYLLRNKAFHHLFTEAEYLLDTLGRFKAVLVFLEKYHFGRCHKLARLCEPFWKVKSPPSKYLKRIALIAAAAGTQKSEVLWLLLNVIVPWDLYFSYRLERYKKKVRAVLPQWLDTWYELEALCSIANFAYLHPNYVFPEIVWTADAGVQPVFQAHDMGHPLLPDDEKVSNDFTVETLGEISIITGSNMSGKSTFLRTVGINLCLAYAGGPVNASSFQSLPSRIFSCINVSDSINDGISYFYAEVRRLKALLSALQQDHHLPLFFLIDEIFRGTNNRERLIGSRAYVQALAGYFGVGLISTHDLELVKLSTDIPFLKNKHFREDVMDGRMVFDYRLRPGPCPTTNALKIMKMEGLPVEFIQSYEL